MVRIKSVDALRGFALFGIAVVNVPFLAAPFGQVLAGGMADEIAAFAISLLFQGKFFLVFAFLFGWGVGVQRDSAARARRKFYQRFFRRQFGLLLIGAAHAVLVFAGDILALYAITGCLLFLLADRGPAVLMRWAMVGVAVGAVSLGIVAIAASQITASETLSGAGYLGTFSESVAQRISELPYAVPFIAMFNGPLVFAAFCAGLAAHKSGFLQPGNTGFARLWQRRHVLLAAGIGANLPFAFVGVNAIPGDVTALVAFASLALAAPVLSTAYIVFVAGWASGHGLKSMSVAGQMSLTAYVMEGVFAGLIFNGYGLGLYNQLGMAAVTAVAVGVFLTTELFCRTWRYAFGQGPLERMLRAVAR